MRPLLVETATGIGRPAPAFAKLSHSFPVWKSNWIYCNIWKCIARSLGHKILTPWVWQKHVYWTCIENVQRNKAFMCCEQFLHFIIMGSIIENDKDFQNINFNVKALNDHALITIVDYVQRWYTQSKGKLQIKFTEVIVGTMKFKRRIRSETIR